MSRLGFKNLILPSQWSNYLGLGAIAIALLSGLWRILSIDWQDPLHCSALLHEGTWLDKQFKNWQPQGCMTHQYTSDDVAHCLDRRNVVFIGDSVTRKLFVEFANIVEGKSSSPDMEPIEKHADILRTHPNTGQRTEFYWDPYLNSTHTHEILRATKSPQSSMLVLGSGLWYLRYKESGGLPKWMSTMESTLKELNSSNRAETDAVFVLPVEDVVASKLNRERAATMLPSDIDAMNSDLTHRILALQNSKRKAFSSSPWPQFTISTPAVFNSMLDASQTEDGLHFSNAMVRTQANLLLNIRCNDKLQKTFPLDKTCCARYPRPSLVQILIVLGVVAAFPIYWYSASESNLKLWAIKEDQLPLLIYSGSIALIYLSDRSWFWLKEQKQFDPWIFTALILAGLVIGLLTLQRSEKEGGFLNRDQTDEWKGWMQIVILIYHYVGASKTSGIYNPIRVLVAAYLFMTGYGHTLFYLRKADFGFIRVAQVLLRLNIYTLLLAFTMNTDYLFYYFAPLVSMWYLIVYATLAAGHQYNNKIPFLLGKILILAGITTWLLKEQSHWESVFTVLRRLCRIHWSAKEWTFRVNLDLYIVWIGMLCGVALMHLHESHLMESRHWPHVVIGSSIASILALIWYFIFELQQESKFTYNKWHPLISAIPILAFIALRNANTVLRSSYSKAFAFIGKCSLETFIIQYHLWLAADTKGLLVIIPGAKWQILNFAISTAMFIFVSHYVSEATNAIVAVLCKVEKSAATAPPLPTTIFAAEEGTAVEDADTVDPLPKDEQSSLEPETPVDTSRRHPSKSIVEVGIMIRSRTGIDIFHLGLKSKICIILFVMWLANLLW